MITKRIRVNHGILFVFDPHSPVPNVPEYIPSTPVSANDVCVSISVRHEIDGDVLVSMGRMAPTDPCDIVVFEGGIATPSGRVAIVTSGNEEVICLEHERPHAKLRIQIDQIEHAERVHVEVD
jgi:hypothetical protein